MTARPKDGEDPGRGEGGPLALRKERCVGCTHCMRVCPTEAVRIRRAKAEIMSHRCIHCGECLRACPREAWEVPGEPLEAIRGRGPAAAVLDPAVLAQFLGPASPEAVLRAFREAGFLRAHGMGEGLALAASAAAAYLSSGEAALPAISSNCPAVVQLVQVKFPSLLENLVPVAPAYEITACGLKEKAGAAPGPDLYYVVPCLAKARAATRPLVGGPGGYFRAVSGGALYSSLQASLRGQREKPSRPSAEEIAASGLEWSFPGGESRAVGIEAFMAVDGIGRVAEVLDLAENGRLAEVVFIEAWSCPGGCLGGELNVKNPSWARFQLSSWIRKSLSRAGERRPPRGGKAGAFRSYRIAEPLSPRMGMRLDEDLQAAMEKLRRIDEVVKQFPGIDCGACGCPNCLALAEDVVQGHARQADCLYVLKGTPASRQRAKGEFSGADPQDPAGNGEERSLPK